MLRHIFELDGTNFKRAQWVLRSELGEGWGRPHYHFLVRNLKKRNSINKHHCIALQKHWEGKYDSIAKVRPFHKWIDGAAKYVVKEANRYEVGKFGTAIETEFSNSYRESIIQRNNYNNGAQQEAFHASEVIA